MLHYAGNILINTYKNLLFAYSLQAYSYNQYISVLNICVNEKLQFLKNATLKPNPITKLPERQAIKQKIK